MAVEAWIIPRMWEGETVVCAASGQSLSHEQIDLARGRARLVVVNNAYELAPWADLLYACDKQWWDHYRPKFSGEKATVTPAVAAQHQCRWVRGKNMAGLSFNPEHIHYGDNSGFQAFNIAVLAGARRILLIGYDMHGTHFFGPHPPELSARKPPKQENFAKFASAFQKAAPMAASAGIEVLNCSPGSALTCFPKADLAEVLCAAA